MVGVVLFWYWCVDLYFDFVGDVFVVEWRVVWYWFGGFVVVFCEWFDGLVVVVWFGDGFFVGGLVCVVVGYVGLVGCVVVDF